MSDEQLENIERQYRELLGRLPHCNCESEINVLSAELGVHLRPDNHVYATRPPLNAAGYNTGQPHVSGDQSPLALLPDELYQNMYGNGNLDYAAYIILAQAHKHKKHPKICTVGDHPSLHLKQNHPRLHLKQNHPRLHLKPNHPRLHQKQNGPRLHQK